MGSRKISNFCWACILFFRNLISLFPSQQRVFFPQGIVMYFYDIAGLFISSYLWCTILWSIGSGYDKFDRKEGIVCIFHWGFPGRNHVCSIRIEVKGGLFPRRVLYMKIGGRGDIPLMHTDENLAPREIGQKAAESAYFLHVPIEVF
ncbi:unnamed protein product [Victoria cruziana]